MLFYLVMKDFGVNENIKRKSILKHRAVMIIHTGVIMLFAEQFYVKLVVSEHPMEESEKILRVVKK